jgi:hypothetical protein
VTTRRVYVIRDHEGRPHVTTQIGPYIQCPNYGWGRCHYQFRTMENLLKHIPKCEHDGDEESA